MHSMIPPRLPASETTMCQANHKLTRTWMRGIQLQIWGRASLWLCTAPIKYAGGKLTAHARLGSTWIVLVRMILSLRGSRRLTCSNLAEASRGLINSGLATIQPQPDASQGLQSTNVLL